MKENNELYKQKKVKGQQCNQSTLKWLQKESVSVAIYTEDIILA